MTKIKIFNDGFIELVDVMGNDIAIVQAARISYGEGIKTYAEDRNLIRYLMKHRHTSPFEMCELKFHVRVPMDTWRQWIRHRTANVNEYSTRYKEAIDSCQITNPNEWRTQSTTNKQGSSKFLDEKTGGYLTERELKFQEAARELYTERLGLGVAREQARKDLPLSTYTEAYWKIDLHNLLHFLELRMDEHAQLEIRTFANAISNIIKKIFPITWEAFVDYRLEAITFSRFELVIIKDIIQNGDFTKIKELTTREQTEFRKKIRL